MNTNRREFIEQLGATAMVGALPLASFVPSGTLALPIVASDEFDFGWTKTVKSKAHKALFDCAEIESGYGVWRAGMWEGQYQAAFGTKPQDSITVLVLRHKALALAFQQDYWDANKLGADGDVKHPITQQSTDVNPALMSSAHDGIPAELDGLALPRLLARGVVVLACNVALGFHAAGMAKKNNITEDEALKRAKAALLPGVRLQPSGVFACVLGQEQGCQYVRAS